MDDELSVDKGVTFGCCRINHLLFGDDLILIPSSEQHLQHVLKRFSAACDRAGMKIGTEKVEVLYGSSETQANVRCK